MTLQRLIELEVENKRLREALEPFAKYSELIHKDRKHFTIPLPPPFRVSTERQGTDYWLDSKQLKAAELALSQPTPTTGLLDVVRAAVKWQKEKIDDAGGVDHLESYAWSHFCEEDNSLFDKVEALPPEVMKMVEEVE